MKKGQAALEFLMTYGWAMIMVMAMMGVFGYYYMGNLSSFLPDRCMFMTGLDCVDTAVIDTATNSVQFMLRNNIGNVITIDPGRISSTGNCDAGSAQSSKTVANAGDMFKVTLSCSKDLANGRFKETVSIYYTDGVSGLAHLTSGEIIGQAESY